MRLTQRVISAAIVITGLAPVGVASAASAATATSTAYAATSAITVKATIPVAAAGVVATNPRTDTVYVAGGAIPGSLSVINGRTNTVTATITLGDPVTGFAPAGAAVNPLTT